MEPLIRMLILQISLSSPNKYDFIKDYLWKKYFRKLTKNKN
jgi:hypothetical protein